MYYRNKYKNSTLLFNFCEVKQMKSLFLHNFNPKKLINILFAFLLICSPAYGQTGDKKISVKQSDWRVICGSTTQTTPDNKSCRMSQSLLDPKGGKPLLIVRVFTGKQPSLLIQTPLQVFLKAGVVVQVDRGKRYAFAYEFCTAEGCYAGIPLPKSLLNSFKRGNTAVFHVKDTAGQQASFNVSLKGFTSTYQELSRK